MNRSNKLVLFYEQLLWNQFIEEKGIQERKTRSGTISVLCRGGIVREGSYPTEVLVRD